MDPNLNYEKWVIVYIENKLLSYNKLLSPIIYNFL